MLKLVVLFVLVGLLFVVVSVPLVRRKVGPNPWYGFRTRKTLANPDVWFAANEFMAWRLLWLGIATICTSIISGLLPGMTEGAFGLAMAMVVFFGVVTVLVKSLTMLKDIPSADVIKSPQDD